MRRVLARRRRSASCRCIFSGGEPMAAARAFSADRRRQRWRSLQQSHHLRHAWAANARSQPFCAAGLKHVSSAFRISRGDNDSIAGLAGAHARKTKFAAAVRAAGLPLRLNMVVHRQNLGGVPE